MDGEQHLEKLELINLFNSTLIESIDNRYNFLQPGLSPIPQFMSITTLYHSFFLEKSVILHLVYY